MMQVALLQGCVLLADALLVMESAVFFLYALDAFFARSPGSSSPLSPAEAALGIFLVGQSVCALSFAGGAVLKRERFVLANRDLLISNALALYVCAAAFFVTDDSEFDNAPYGVVTLVAALVASGGAKACEALALVLRGLSELPAGPMDSAAAKRSFSHGKIRV